MYRDVPASSGTCVTAKQHPCTSCPSSRAPLAAECDSGVMAHESGNNGKRGMFRLILRSRFHFLCNNFVNQKGRCVMLSVHLELYIFRALCKHFFCTSDFMMGGDGKSVCSEVRTVSTTSFIYCCGFTWYCGQMISPSPWASVGFSVIILELCSLRVGC